jgi:hypothetical protein
MFELLEIELTRVRKMAEHAGDAFLLYLIDMAILQANAEARSNAGGREAVGLRASPSGRPRSRVKDRRIARDPPATLNARALAL